MKKIAILTLPLTENFGGILQATALYNFLVDKNYDVVFLKNSYLSSKWKAWLWKVIEKIPFHNFKNHRATYLRRKFHTPFISQHISKQSSLLTTIADFESISKKHNFDAVIVGSDQVWRWDYISDGFDRYFLNFVNEKKTRKIAYAASFGKPYWQAQEHQDIVAEYLRSFHAVSIRETDAVAICKTLQVPNCQQVLDPTLLVEKSFYTKFLLRSESNPVSKTLLTYLLDENPKKTEFIRLAAQALGSEYIGASLSTNSNVTVQAWLTSFYEAEFIITDSFHGMVFSILFNKQFLVISNAERGVSRFISLLEQLNLLDRLLDDDLLDVKSISMLFEKQIDYTAVEQRLKLLREASASFLINALN